MMVAGDDRGLRQKEGSLGGAAISEPGVPESSRTKKSPARAAGARAGSSPFCVFGAGQPPWPLWPDPPLPPWPLSSPPLAGGDVALHGSGVHDVAVLTVPPAAVQASAVR